MNYALVTGATSGIGLAIAEALLAEGCFVFLNFAHNTNRADRVRNQLAEYHGRFDMIRADLSGYEDADTIVSSLRERGIKLKYLVLNFGETDRTSFGEVGIDDWERIMRANVSVPFFLIQSLWKVALVLQASSVLGVSSLMADVPHSVSVSYGVSKAALSALCRNLVKFLAPTGVCINAVEPGFVDTPWQKEKLPEHRARIESKIALGRLADTQEVAELCLAILKNTYLTGSVIQISGGYGME